MSKIVCDSGPLISFSSTCLVKVLRFLSHKGGEFLIPRAVESEIVLKPINVSRYAFSALRLRKSIEDGDLEIVNVDQSLVDSIVHYANSSFSIRGKQLRLLHSGEAACLAVYKQFKCDALAIDEKTTRLMVEDPALLQENISLAYNARVMVNQKAISEFTNLVGKVNVIRSSELLVAAARRGYFDSFGSDAEPAFHAAIYSLKNAGCGLSEKEVQDYQVVKL
ncbi:MAG: hypothetical protein V1722_04895 [Candidatus Micrarchaeota archaeon]